MPSLGGDEQGKQGHQEGRGQCLVRGHGQGPAADKPVLEEFIVPCQTALREHSPLLAAKDLMEQTMTNPAEVVKVNQRVTVTVLGVDLERRHNSVSMKSRSG